VIVSMCDMLTNTIYSLL